MKAHFYTLLLGPQEEDITRHVDGINYEDSVEKDDLLKFSIKRTDTQMVDNDGLVAGATVKFHFGYKGGKISPVRLARVVGIDVSYGDCVNITVEALDAGVDMRRGSSNKVWEGLTGSQIAEKIAEQNGLGKNIEPTTHVHGSMPQAGRSDFDMCRHLAGLEGNGEYIFYIKDGVLCFHDRDLGQESAKTYVYGTANANVISFSCKIAENSKNKAGAGVSATGVDAMSGEVGSATATAANAEDNTLLGGNISDMVNFDQFGTEQPSPTPPSVAAALAVNAMKSGEQEYCGPDPQRARKKANAKHKQGAMEGFKADLTIEGDPFIRAGQVITMQGVAKKHMGNWYVRTVKHKLGTSYLTTLELARNASDGRTSTTSGPAPEGAATNQSVGGDDTDRTVDTDRVYISQFGDEIPPQEFTSPFD